MLDELEVDPSFGCVIIGALRHALERTYLPSDVAIFIRRHMNFFDDIAISIMINDISQALEIEDIPLREMWEELRTELEVETYARNNNWRIKRKRGRGVTWERN